jgi:hypothetical protein
MVMEAVPNQNFSGRNSTTTRYTARLNATAPATMNSSMTSSSDPVQPERVGHHQRKQGCPAEEVDEIAHGSLLK